MSNEITRDDIKALLSFAPEEDRNAPAVRYRGQLIQTAYLSADHRIRMHIEAQTYLLLKILERLEEKK